jgi:hypothetical protein
VNREAGTRIYHVEISQQDQGYIVTYRYGKQGGKLREGHKNQRPVSLDRAEQLFEQQLKSTQKRGYTLVEDQQVAPSSARPPAEKSSDSDSDSGFGFEELSRLVSGMDPEKLQDFDLDDDDDLDGLDKHDPELPPLPPLSKTGKASPSNATGMDLLAAAIGEALGPKAAEKPETEAKPGSEAAMIAALENLMGTADLGGGPSAADLEALEREVEGGLLDEDDGDDADIAAVLTAELNASDLSAAAGAPSGTSNRNDALESGERVPLDELDGEGVVGAPPTDRMLAALLGGDGAPPPAAEPVKRPERLPKNATPAQICDLAIYRTIKTMLENDDLEIRSGAREDLIEELLGAVLAAPTFDAALNAARSKLLESDRVEEVYCDDDAIKKTFARAFEQVQAEAS